MASDEENVVVLGGAPQPSQQQQTAAAAAANSDTRVVAEPGSIEPEEKTEHPAAKRVPRPERRGLFGRFTVVPELSSSSDYPRSTKWFMTVIVALAGATSSTGSSIFYPALGEVAKDLHTTQSITNLSLAFYLLAMAFTPLWWSSLSETLGRRTVYLVSFALFTIFSVASAVSVNISMLIVFRVLSGGAAASVQAVGAGTVSDLWKPQERGAAMGIFYLGPLCGPGLAPIIGGALTQGLGWRSTLWFLVIFSGMLLFLILFFLPETLPRPKTQSNKKKATVRSIAKRVVAPVLVLSYLQYPAVLVCVYSAAVAFGSLYIVNISISSVFLLRPYSFTTTEVGLFYLAPTLGYAVASILGGRWTDFIMARQARRFNRVDGSGKPILLPEDRLRENIWLAATLYPAGMIWYGWSVDKELHWAVGAVATLFFGVGGMLVFGAVTTALTEFLPGRSSSGVALNNFMRSLFATVGVVITQPLTDAVGTGWMCTIVGLFAWVTGNLAIFALVRLGPRWRVEMDKKLKGDQK